MRNTRIRHWLALTAAVVLGGVSALAAFGSFINIFSAGHDGVSPQAAIITAVLAVVVVVVCVRWAVHAEHRLRTHDAGRPGARVRPEPAERRRLYHHRHGPVTVTIGAVLFTLIALGMVIGAVQSFGAWRLSGYVQSQGALVPGTVTRVVDIEHRGRSDWYTAQVTVLLQRPVGGVATTTVNDPTAAAVAAGEPVTVRVDPRRPGYAEFPGKPYGDAGAWISMAVFGLFMVLISGVYWGELATRIRHRRRTALLPAG